jgi:hypothetical protein
VRPNAFAFTTTSFIGELSPDKTAMMGTKSAQNIALIVAEIS